MSRRYYPPRQHDDDDSAMRRTRLSLRNLFALGAVLIAGIQYTLVGYRVHHDDLQPSNNNAPATSLLVHDLNRIAGALSLPTSSSARLQPGTEKKAKKKRPLGLWQKKLEQKRKRQLQGRPSFLERLYKAVAVKPKPVEQKPQQKTNPSSQDDVVPTDDHPSVEDLQNQQLHREGHPQHWFPGKSFGAKSISLANNPVPLKVNFPIFVASLPKSGTTSIWQYFNCGGHPANHQWITDRNNVSMPTGQCIRNNIQNRQPPFQGCGHYRIFTDTGFANYANQKSDCFYPSVDALEAISQNYPQATILLVVRNTTEWYTSMKQWVNGSLLDRWRPCNATGFPKFAARPCDFRAFYEWHTQQLRDFGQRHPSITFLEFALESPQTGQMLQERVGIPSACWAKCTPSSKFCEPIGPVIQRNGTRA